ncbi:HNH endonuclease, partial [Bacillus wiedmannii]
MAISVKTRKLLWGKSASRCSFPECKMELVMDETETDDASIVGEECHIIAREDDGPRGISDISKKERDKYANLILMCNVHHKLIDDQEHTYTVDILKEFKNNHEAWVSESLKIDDFKFKDDLIYSSYIDKWVERVDLDNWQSWTSRLLSSGQPSIY